MRPPFCSMPPVPCSRLPVVFLLIIWNLPQHFWITITKGGPGFYTRFIIVHFYKNLLYFISITMSSFSRENTIIGLNVYRLRNTSRVVKDGLRYAVVMIPSVAWSQRLDLRTCWAIKRIMEWTKDLQLWETTKCRRMQGVSQSILSSFLFQYQIGLSS